MYLLPPRRHSAKRISREYDTSDEEDDEEASENQLQQLRRTHTQRVVGVRHAHPIKSALKQARKAHTIGNIASLEPSWDSPYGTMTVSELPMQLQLFCDREGMAHTAMSDDTAVHVGTRITIWAENSHISLGSAFAHPNVHGRERYDACRAQLRFCQLV